MRVKIILKKPAPNGMKEFIYREQAVLDDKEAGYAVFSGGYVTGGIKSQENYAYKEMSHIVYSWDDIERLEIMPDES